MTIPAIRHPWLGIDYDISVRGQATLQAIKCLRKSGEKSFEKLTATLLSLLIGFPIRLCKSKSDHTILVHTPCRAPQSHRSIGEPHCINLLWTDLDTRQTLMPCPTPPRSLLPSRINAIRLGVLIFATWRGNLQQLLGPILTYSSGACHNSCQRPVGHHDG